MKFPKLLSLFVALALVFGAVIPASAQLGATDVSSFTVQNIDTVKATVTVMFVAEDGTTRTPTTLNAGKVNPFDLQPGESWEIYLPGIPDAQLPDGRYSVVISATAQVAAIANLLGQGGLNFNGSYSGLSTGSNTFYLPSTYFNYYGWYSMISVQNVGASPANITVDLTCTSGATGQLTANSVPVNASYHFVLKNVVPTGFTAATVCVASAKITGTQPIVVVDNQSVPTNNPSKNAGGNTQSYSGMIAGYPTLYVPALYQGYYGWVSSLTIQKLEPGDTTVTVTYSDGTTPTQVLLTDAIPGKELYMPNLHAYSYKTLFGATITNSAGLDLVAVANSANGRQAQTYNAFGVGSVTVGIPTVNKYYYGWISSFTCQNVGAVKSSMNISYQNYEANGYSTAELNPGTTVEIFQPNESFLPNGYRGSVTVVANNAAAQIACIANFNQPANMANGATLGDWSMSYNAFNK